MSNYFGKTKSTFFIFKPDSNFDESQKKIPYTHSKYE